MPVRVKKEPRNRFNLYWDLRRRGEIYKHGKAKSLIKSIPELYGLDKAETWRQKGVNWVNDKLEKQYATSIDKKEAKKNMKLRQRQQEHIEEAAVNVAKTLAISKKIRFKRFFTRSRIGKGLRRARASFYRRPTIHKTRVKIYKFKKNIPPAVKWIGGIAAGIGTATAIDVGAEGIRMRAKRKFDPEYDLHLRQLGYERRKRIGHFDPRKFEDILEEKNKKQGIINKVHTKANAIVAIMRSQGQSLKQQMAKHPRDKHYTLRSRWKKKMVVGEDMDIDPIMNAAARIYEGLIFQRNPGQFRMALGAATGNAAMAMRGSKKMMRSMVSDVDTTDNVTEIAPAVAAFGRIVVKDAALGAGINALASGLKKTRVVADYEPKSNIDEWIAAAGRVAPYLARIAPKAKHLAKRAATETGMFVGASVTADKITKTINKQEPPENQPAPVTPPIKPNKRRQV